MTNLEFLPTTLMTKGLESSIQYGNQREMLDARPKMMSRGARGRSTPG